MKKTILSILVLSCFLFTQTFAAGPVLPKPVKDLFGDIMVVMIKLGKDLKASTSARAVSKSFDTATAGLKDKKVGERYASLSAQYPDLFEGDDDFDEADIPPEWATMLADYEEAWSDYAESTQAIMKYGEDPAVQKSIKAFEEEINKLDMGNDEEEYDATTAATEETE